MFVTHVQSKTAVERRGRDVRHLTDSEWLAVVFLMLLTRPALAAFSVSANLSNQYDEHLFVGVWGQLDSPYGSGISRELSPDTGMVVRVLDNSNGTPIPSAKVQLSVYVYANQGAAVTQGYQIVGTQWTNSTGYAEFNNLSGNNQFIVDVSKDGYSLGEQQVNVNVGEKPVVTVRLSPAPSYDQGILYLVLSGLGIFFFVLIGMLWRSVGGGKEGIGTTRGPKRQPDY